MLTKEFEYFLNNQDVLVDQYNGKFIVIKDEIVIGVYETNNEAYDETIKTHELGTFLIQKCIPGDQAHTQTFYTNLVSFS